MKRDSTQEERRRLIRELPGYELLQYLAGEDAPAPAAPAKAAAPDADEDIITVSVQLTRGEWSAVKDIAWERYVARGKRGRQDASAVVREALARWFAEEGK